jgi:hypothetical protein
VGVAGLAAVGGLVVEMMPSPPGPAHEIGVPARISPFVQAPALAAKMKATSLRDSIVSASKGEASHVVDAVYQDTADSQVLLFIGGNLAGSSANSFISSFIGSLPGAVTTSPGSLGGAAACVPSVSGHPAECAWADDDTFGVLLSATMSATDLAGELRLMRPQLEHHVK